MRRTITILAHGLPFASALFFLVSSFLTYRSFNQDPVFEFTRHGMLWEVAFHDGIGSLDNQPQCLKEAAEFEARTDYLQEGLHQAWGTTEWRGRLNYFQKLEREQAAVATPAVAHTLRMLPVILLSAALTTTWIVVGLQHYPKQRKRLARFAFASSGLLALMIFVATIVMAWRSRFTVDMIGKPTRWHYYKGVFGKGGAVLQSFHLVRRTQSVVQTFPSIQQQVAQQRLLIQQQQLMLTQQPLSKQQLAIQQQIILQQQRFWQPTVTPVGPYSDVPILYANSDFARQRETASDVKAERWGRWKWRKFEVTPRFSLAQLTWVNDPPKYGPWVSTLSQQFGSQILGRSTLPSQTLRETWLIGHTLWIPYWLLIAVSGGWSWIVIRSLYKSRRARNRTINTRCPECGYDIRATPQRCPECGSAVRGQRAAI